MGCGKALEEATNKFAEIIDELFDGLGPGTRVGFFLCTYEWGLVPMLCVPCK